MLRPLLSEQAKITTQPRLRILCCLLLEPKQNGHEEKGWILLCCHLPSTTQAGTLVKWRPQLSEMCRWHRGHLLMGASHATLPLKCCPTSANPVPMVLHNRCQNNTVVVLKTMRMLKAPRIFSLTINNFPYRKDMSNEQPCFLNLEQKKKKGKAGSGLEYLVATNHFYEVEPEVSCCTICCHIAIVQKLIGFVNLLARK